MNKNKSTNGRLFIFIFLFLVLTNFWHITSKSILIEQKKTFYKTFTTKMLSSMFIASIHAVKKGNTMISFIISLIIGAIAGWLAGQFVKGRSFGLFGNLIVGIIGSVIGGFVFGILGLSATSLLGSIITSTCGAVILLYIVNYLRFKS